MHHCPTSQSARPMPSQPAECAAASGHTQTSTILQSPSRFTLQRLGLPTTLVLWLLCLPSEAGPPKDLNVRVIDFNAEGVGVTFANSGGVYWAGQYFFSGELDDGSELHISDGVATLQLKDLRPGPEDSAPLEFTRVGAINDLASRVFFTADLGVSGRELWVTDATEDGTQVVFDYLPHLSSLPESLTAWNGDLYLSADVTGGEFTLHKVDPGTLAVTTLGLANVLLPPEVELESSGGLLYFAGNPLTPQIWSTDSGEPTVETDVACDAIGDLLGVSGELFFVCENGIGTYLMRLDGGVAAGAVEVHAEPAGTEIAQLTASGGYLYFVRDQEDLLAYDNTSGVVSTAQDYAAFAAPLSLRAFNGSLIYSVHTSAEGREAWLVTGTAAPVLLDSRPGTGSGVTSSTFFVERDDVAYFGLVGAELWRTEGTAATTSLVIDLQESGSSGGISSLHNTPLGLFFSGGSQEVDLWLSDGTELGTVTLSDPVSFSSDPEGLLYDPYGERVFFHGENPQGREPAVSDGTQDGTHVVVDGVPGPDYVLPRFEAALPDPSRGTSSSVAIYRRAEVGVGTQLWKTDGTEMGTEQISLLSTNPSAGFVRGGVLNNQFLFRVDDEVHGQELWTTDGTSAGTQLLIDLNPTGDGASSHFTVVGSHLYYTGNDGLSGIELWRTDGTAVGTELVKDIELGPNGSSLGSFVGSSSHLYFFDSSKETFWVSDGTAAGTVSLGSLYDDAASYAVDGDNVFLVGYDETFENQLWYATPTSLQRLTDFIDDSKEPQLLGTVGTRAVFWAHDGTQDGLERLWAMTSTGSPTLLGTFNSRSDDSDDAAVSWQGWLYFQAETAAQGNDLWRTDGIIIEPVDLAPGPASSSPELMTTAGDRLFLSAWDATAKHELFVLWPSLPIFDDGFESGDTLEWSTTLP